MKLVVELADSGLELSLIVTPIQQKSVCGYGPYVFITISIVILGIHK